MTENSSDRSSEKRPHITQEQHRQLLRRLGEVNDRVSTLQILSLRAACIVTSAVLLLGLLLPFLVPRSGDQRSLTSMQAVGIDANSSLDVIEDWGAGAIWLIPIFATLLVIGVTLSLTSGARPGWTLGIRRFLTGAYLFGCLLGFVTLSVGERTANAPLGLVVLTLGAVLAVGVSAAAPALADHRTPGGRVMGGSGLGHDVDDHGQRG